jgi:hypothetical protein
MSAEQIRETPEHHYHKISGSNRADSNRLQYAPAKQRRLSTQTGESQTTCRPSGGKRRARLALAPRIQKYVIKPIDAVAKTKVSRSEDFSGSMEADLRDNPRMHKPLQCESRIGSRHPFR